MPQEYTGKVIKKLLPDSLAGKSYSKTNQTPLWIVIHNMGNGTNQGSYNWWSQGAGGANTSAHYCVDDKEIWQTLEDNWKGYHAGTPKKGQYGADRGACNSNSIGIEMADYESVDKNKALELTIELTRYLCKKYNIPYDNIIQHYDVSGKDCPMWIRNNNKWDYLKTEAKRRNEENIAISFDSSLLTSGNISSGDMSSNISGGSVGLPNFDNREDMTNLKEVKGIVLIHHPPEHFYSVEQKEEAWIKLGYQKEFHYLIDSLGAVDAKSTDLIADSIQDNNRYTYINSALYSNKAIKNTLAIGIFTSQGLEDYTVTEKKLIDKIGLVLWENGLETKDLWREFDLNRAPSPFMYLDREQWKKFLIEIDKQVQWRYANFGEPELPEKPIDISNGEDNIGRKGKTLRTCTLREQPNMTSAHVKVLQLNVDIEITDYYTGFYKVLVTEDNSQGWIVAESIAVNDTADNSVKNLNIKSKTDNKIPQPEITPTMTHKEYLFWKDLTDPTIIDNFAGECEPYDKGIKEIIDYKISNDDRLASLNKKMETYNENTIYYSVTEGSPGDTGHCVKATAELNALYKPDPFNVEPVYPDLIIPPNYYTSDNNIKTDSVPLTALEDGTAIKDIDSINDKSTSFDFSSLEDKKKESKGMPINYLDPYPYDDKIYELEKHSPKVKIDEIESRLYESNHPGDPMPQPVAKNFAMINDALLNQSKNIETRLIRIENVLSFVLRNLGRTASRVNINCVYYGGQDIFGKYKTIRCLRDDRIHDACSVTLDQCLCCTRYEPIVGQIYEILDDTGLNGSYILDQMQMSYMNLDDVKNLNRIENRNSSYKYVNVNKEEKETPKEITEEWKELNKNKYIETLKKEITNEKELEEKIAAIKEEDYSFIMNWYLQDEATQEPDVKPYPIEGIKAKFKKTNLGDAGEDSENTKEEKEENKEDDQFDYLIDKDDEQIKDEEYYGKLNNGEWVDTRENADTVEKVVYSSENYYFEDFNIDRGNLGADSTPGGTLNSNARQMICEMANQIVQDHANGIAGYNNIPPRTEEYDKPIKGNVPNMGDGIVKYDCSSFAACCYNNAKLKTLVGKNATGQISYFQAQNSEFWVCDKEGVAKAKPGDLIYDTGQKVTKNNLKSLKSASHVIVYMGDNKIAHASKNSVAPPQQIRIDDIDWVVNTGTYVFVTPADLAKAETDVTTGNFPSDVKGITNGKPSLAFLRFMKGQEGFNQYGTKQSGESFRTGGYGVTEKHAKEYFDKLAPWPTTEQKATTIFCDIIEKEYTDGLFNEMKKAGFAVDKMKQHQFDAFCDLCYNAGIGGTKSSPMWNLAKNNLNDPQIATKWLSYATTSNGKVLSGLVSRRQWEADMYSKGSYYYKPINIIGSTGKIVGNITENGGHGYMPSGWIG